MADRANTQKKNVTASRSDSEWRARLTEEQYRVCRCNGTERPFSGKFYEWFAEGTYFCVCCDTALFDHVSKYDSGSGWPSFYDVIDKDSVTRHSDASHNMERVEIRCATCDAHLGHVFSDGPPPTGLRYCVNSVALTHRPPH